MKEQIIEIIRNESDTSAVKATRIIILFNQHLLENAKKSETVAEFLEKTFINL
jgi:hypothetical protein